MGEPVEPGGVEAGLGYRPALDGVRAIAIALVLSSHTFQFPATRFLGVDLFFVLSGFLITTLLLEERVRHGAVSLRGFYRRRALRLLPALVTLLGVFLVAFAVSATRGDSPEVALFGVLAGIAYFTNIVVATGPDGVALIPVELHHLWSLAIEEQFYLVWPLVLLLVFRARPRPALVGLGVVFVLGVGQDVRLYLDGADWLRIAHGSDTRSTSIVAGCLLAVALTTAARDAIGAFGRRLTPIALGCAAALLVLAPSARTFGVWAIGVAFTCAWLVLVALDHECALARALSVQPLVFFGRISYSLYLWHLPVYVLVGVSNARLELLDVVAAGGSVACATLSYYLVELPFLRRKRRRDARDDAPSRTEAERRSAAAPALSPAGS